MLQTKHSIRRNFPLFGRGRWITEKLRLYFRQYFRELSDGKPIGFKLSIGRKSEFIAICKAMYETGILADFITIDGGRAARARLPSNLPIRSACRCAKPLRLWLTVLSDSA